MRHNEVRTAVVPRLERRPGGDSQTPRRRPDEESLAAIRTTATTRALPCANPP